MITPKNFIRHEIIGLQVEIIDSENKQHIGTNGTVVNETKKMLTIRTNKGDKRYQKSKTKFMFNVPGKFNIIVDGKRLAGNPEERIKAKVKKW